MVCAAEKLGQMNEYVADKLGYGGVGFGGEAAGLSVQFGRYGDGDVSDFRHGLGSLWRAEFGSRPLRTIVRNRERLSAKRGQNKRLGMREMPDILGGRG